jgi:hypothetical protein
MAQVDSLKFHEVTTCFLLAAQCAGIAEAASAFEDALRAIASALPLSSAEPGDYMHSGTRLLLQEQISCFPGRAASSTPAVCHTEVSESRSFSDGPCADQPSLLCNSDAAAAPAGNSRGDAAAVCKTAAGTSSSTKDSAADAVESPADVAKRWASKFQTTISSSKSPAGGLGVQRSASTCDLHLSTMPSPMLKFSLHLSVSVRNTNFGDKLILSGSNEALGMWQPGNSPSLTTSAATFPIWSIDLCISMKRSSLPLEFKFAIIREGSGVVVSFVLKFRFLIPRTC